MFDKVGGSNQSIQQMFTQQKEKIEIVQEKNEIHSVTVERPQKEEMEKIVQGMNDFLKPSNTHLKFEFHDELQEYYVSIVDNITQEVVKEIPPKKLLDMYAAMTQFMGVLMDKKI